MVGSFNSMVFCSGKSTKTPKFISLAIFALMMYDVVLNSGPRKSSLPEIAVYWKNGCPPIWLRSNCYSIYMTVSNGKLRDPDDLAFGVINAY